MHPTASCSATPRPVLILTMCHLSHPILPRSLLFQNQTLVLSDHRKSHPSLPAVCPALSTLFPSYFALSTKSCPSHTFRFLTSRRSSRLSPPASPPRPPRDQSRFTRRSSHRAPVRPISPRPAPSRPVGIEGEEER